MTGMVTADPGLRRLAGDGWSLRAEGVELLGADGWRAVIGVRRGLKLLVTGTGQPELRVAAWTAEPGEPAGVAVIDAGDGVLQLARVPLCECGDRGCGNAGVQLDKQLAGNALPALVDLLRELPWARVAATRSNVPRGSGLAAIDQPWIDQAPGGWYARAPLTGKSWHPYAPGQAGAG